jgi:hypothetical protein
MEIRVQKSLNVILQLDEQEATRLAAILFQTVDHDTVPLARELYSSLSGALDNLAPEASFVLMYDQDADLFVPEFA